jgi:tripartite motif-containing protein 71
MQKQEIVIISVLLAGILGILGFMSMPANMRMDRTQTTVANVLMSGGGPGTGKGQFQTPRDISVDNEGNIYVVDSRNHRIQKFSATGSFIMAWGKDGEKKGEMHEPCGMDIGPDGNIYLIDTWWNRYKGRIEVFDPNGKFLRELGTEKGMFGPRDLAVDTDGNIYVADTGGCKIEKFDKNGANVATFGKRGKNSLEFDEPVGIAMGPDNNIYICDRKNFRIQVLSKNGEYLRQFKVDGWSADQISGGCLMEPYLDIDMARKLIYITDSTNHRVLRYDLEGKKKEIVFQDPNTCPIGVVVLSPGSIAITDSRGARLINFADK